MSFKRMIPHRKYPADTIPMEGIFGHLLDPIDRLGEAIFAILVLLTFTLAFAILELDANPSLPVSVEDVNQLVIGILGATLTWGLIDGVLYALISVFQRGEWHRMLTYIQSAETQEEGINAVADELDYILEPITEPEKRQRFYAEIYEHLQGNQPRRVKLTGEDLLGAFGCVLVWIIAVLPSMVPLVLLRSNFDLAIRLSNLVSFGVLFYAGYHWGKYSGTNPVKTGLLLLVIGVVLAVVAIPLGG